jgi:hypothetical protein
MTPADRASEAPAVVERTFQRREFRVPIAEPGALDGVLVSLVGGASRSLADLIERHAS